MTISQTLAKLAKENYVYNDGKKIAQVKPAYSHSTFYVKIHKDTLGATQIDLIYRYYKQTKPVVSFEKFLYQVLFNDSILSDTIFRRLIWSKIRISNEVRIYYENYGFDNFLNKYTLIKDENREIIKNVGDEKYCTIAYILMKNGYYLSENDLVGSTRILHWKDVIESEKNI
jgi:hypothetical protein